MRDWARKWRWHIILSVLISGIVASLLAGYFTQHQFVRDFAANLAADAVVALVAFAVVDMALGLSQREQRRNEAQQKALTLLFTEVTNNQFLLFGILQALKGNAPMPEEWGNLRDDTWTLFVQSPLVADLDQKLLWELATAYMSGEAAIRQARAWRSNPTFRPWNNPPAHLISQVDGAQASSLNALTMLVGGGPDEE